MPRKSKAKWQPGNVLTPVAAFEEIAARRPVYLHHKWTHNGWARGWQVNSLIAWAQAGWLRTATQIQEDDDNE